MSDDVDAIFGSKTPPRPSFTERVSPGQPRAEIDPDLTANDGTYKAYGFFPSGTVGEVCDVRRWIDGTDISEGIEFQYRFLMQIGYVGEEELRLFLPDCIVVIEGKRLTELRKKLARRSVTFIQQHNSKIWPTLPSAEMIVNRITITRPENRLSK